MTHSHIEEYFVAVYKITCNRHQYLTPWRHSEYTPSENVLHCPALSMDSILFHSFIMEEWKRMESMESSSTPSWRHGAGGNLEPYPPPPAAGREWCSASVCHMLAFMFPSVSSHAVPDHDSSTTVLHCGQTCFSLFSPHLVDMETRWTSLVDPVLIRPEDKVHTILKHLLPIHPIWFDSIRVELV